MNSFYNSLSSITPMRFAKWFAVAFTFWITSLILSPFPHYLPPDFEFGFLSNKASYFYSSGYFIGFYLHIAGAPIGLFFGGLQMSRTLRERYARVHRRAGQMYVAVVLCAAAPGGLVMSLKAFGGWSTTICFGSIAIGTWIATYCGWRAARRDDYRRHQRWMLRSYVLLLSAIFLRLGHYLLQSLDWSPRLTYQIAAWASWIPPLILLELVLRINDHAARSRTALSALRDNREIRDR